MSTDPNFMVCANQHLLLESRVARGTGQQAERCATCPSGQAAAKTRAAQPRRRCASRCARPAPRRAAWTPPSSHSPASSTRRSAPTDQVCNLAISLRPSSYSQLHSPMQSQHSPVTSVCLLLLSVLLREARATPLHCYQQALVLPREQMRVLGASIITSICCCNRRVHPFVHPFVLMLNKISGAQAQWRPARQ